MVSKRLRGNTRRYVVIAPMLVMGISLVFATLHFTSVPADSGQAIEAGSDLQEKAALEVYTQPHASAAPRAQKAQIPQHINPEIIAEVSRDLGEPMVGIGARTLKEEDLLSPRGNL